MSLEGKDRERSLVMLKCDRLSLSWLLLVVCMFSLMVCTWTGLLCELMDGWMDRHDGNRNCTKQRLKKNNPLCNFTDIFIHVYIILLCWLVRFVSRRSRDTQLHVSNKRVKRRRKVVEAQEKNKAILKIARIFWISEPKPSSKQMIGGVEGGAVYLPLAARHHYIIFDGNTVQRRW